MQSEICWQINVPIHQKKAELFKKNSKNKVESENLSCFEFDNQQFAQAEEIFAETCVSRFYKLCRKGG